MPDSRAIDAERKVQPLFRNTTFLQLLILAGLILIAARWMGALPDRTELGPRTAGLRFEPVDLDQSGFAGLRLAGAWEVTSDDPRVGGVSALAAEDEDLVAVTDSGAVLRFAKPGRPATPAMVRELPAGPGDPRLKRNRDSEALVRDRGGWWIAFENRDELWLYDLQLRRPLRVIKLGARRWPRNRGIEAAAAAGDALLLLPERGDTVVEVRGSSARTVAIANPRGRISDAVLLPTGEMLVLNRRLTPLGFTSSLALLERTGTAYRLGRRTKLGLGRLDNAEAIAAERLPGGRTRLWLMTDNNFQRPLRTLLIAVDWPA